MTRAGVCFSICAIAVMLLTVGTSWVDAQPPNDRVLFLLGEQFDPKEFWGPYSVLRAAGYRIDLAGAQKDVELTPDSYLPEANVRTTISLDEVEVADYFALVVPGGPSAANISRFPKAGALARKFNADGKLIGTVCHGARLLMPEGIFKDRATTSVFMVADELADQWKAHDYGVYLDLPVVIDRNLVSSRDPRDVPAMAQALIHRFGESGGLKVSPREGRVLIILPNATEHQQWVLGRLNIFGILPTVWSESDAARRGEAPDTSYDMLVILDGTEQMSSSKALADLVGSFDNANKTILITENAKQSLRAMALTSAKVIQGDDLSYAMKHIVESASLARIPAPILYPDSDRWAAYYAIVAATPIKGTKWDPSVEYDAVLALWNGYDDYAAAKMNEFLGRNNRQVLIVGPESGPLSGLNGSKAEIAATYNDRIKLSQSAVIVAPGGVWPKKTRAQQATQPKWVDAAEPARQKRLDWLIAQYMTGRMLVAFGLDSLYIGQRKLFKGKHFASTDQASVIWFGSEGAEYSPEKAIFSDRNLLTAKPLVGVDEAQNLLQEHLIRAKAR
jgi:deglycase